MMMNEQRKILHTHTQTTCILYMKDVYKLFTLSFSSALENECNVYGFVVFTLLLTDQHILGV